MQHFDSTPQQWLLLPQAEYLHLGSADEEEGQTWTAETFPGWTRSVWVHVSEFLSMHPCTTVNISSWIRLSTTSSMCIRGCMCTCSVFVCVYLCVYDCLALPLALTLRITLPLWANYVLSSLLCPLRPLALLWSHDQGRSAPRCTLRVWDCTDVVFTAMNQLCHILVV